MQNEKKLTATVSNGNQKVKNDIVFIAALLALIAIAILLLLLFRTNGDTVIVRIDGSVFGTYSLNENKKVEIKSGDGYNVLVIEDGRAFVESASCPDGICSAHRAIRYNGESIICLPNRVVIEIRSQSKNTPDIVA